MVVQLTTKNELTSKISAPASMAKHQKAPLVLSGCLESKSLKVSFSASGWLNLLPELINLDEDEADNDVHHGRVKLEAVGRHK